ncbi:OLC1v1000543C2 [Oldenlandia corymbosa var. corymbosa]|uniref:OLC1v1000543C2 n=1 Tax=Oldenlandia corymbosa var. corymbosa TaxID=529605 RepID=A0AAV1D337_OLDCO|nr:OLC1v1000543C2 [Oldenlandia corymbosa var. corymbosa]
MAMSSTFLLSLSPHHNPVPSHNPILPFRPNFILSRRNFIFTTTSLSFLLLQSQHLATSSAVETSSPPSPPPQSPSSILSGIVNTKSWFQFYGDGFAIRVPPQFEDIMEPEDYNAGLSLYGDKAKPKTFAARFASTDGSEVLSVVTRPSNQLKITFLEAKDITDFGSLKDAAKIFVPGIPCMGHLHLEYSRHFPTFLLFHSHLLFSDWFSYQYPYHPVGGATLYSARTIKVKEDEGFR